MDIDSETEKKIHELQIIEQNLQALLMQKQAIQLEENEAASAISELKKTSDEVYRIIGGIMVKSEKSVLLSELEEKKKILELRVSTLEKQEKISGDKAEKLRKSISDALSEIKKH